MVWIQVRNAEQDLTTLWVRNSRTWERHNDASSHCNATSSHSRKRDARPATNLAHPDHRVNQRTYQQLGGKSWSNLRFYQQASVILGADSSWASWKKWHTSRIVDKTCEDDKWYSYERGDEDWESNERTWAVHKASSFRTIVSTRYRYLGYTNVASQLRRFIGAKNFGDTLCS